MTRAWTLARLLLIDASASSAAVPTRGDFPDVMSFTSRDDQHGNLGTFSDLGAWHGFILPVAGGEGGFPGPWMHEWKHDSGSALIPNSHWLSNTSLVSFAPTVHQPGGLQSQTLVASNLSTSFLPGLFRQTYDIGQVRVTSDLIFIGPRTAAARVAVQNLHDTTLDVMAAFKGDSTVQLRSDGDAVRATIPSNGASEGVSPEVEVLFPSGFSVSVHGKEFRAEASSAESLDPGQTLTGYYTVSLLLNATEDQLAAQAVTADFFAHPEAQFDSNEERWNRYIATVVDPAASSVAQRTAVKAVETLALNWRSAQGQVIPHDGLWPSITTFAGGFWAWDSWKHSAALALFNPQLAADSIRLMFDYQSKHEGDAFAAMIPDVIRHQAGGGINWRDTKPPLAAWAVWQVHRSDWAGRSDFVSEILPKLEAYHAWWYLYRDHDNNGICEFGASDGSVEALAWESGMDNAVRFDDAVMLQNSQDAWSADRESVDLNSYLYVEKRILAELFGEAGDVAKAAAYRADAVHLKTVLQDRFFDSSKGWFFDRRLGTNGSFISVMGCEGYIPLWAGVASNEQAAAARVALLDPEKFRTFVPFPTLAADEPKFDGAGYWRGPVWVDQQYFAVRGLRRYGYDSDVNSVIEQLLGNMQGLDGVGPLNENYNPLTGQTQGSDYFGWTSAHMLMMTAPGGFDVLPGDEDVPLTSLIV